MTAKELFDILNSAMSLGLIVAVLATLWVLILKKDSRSKSSKSSRR